MLPPAIIGVLLLAIIVVAVVLASVGDLLSYRTGWYILLVGVVIVPLAASFGGAGYGFVESSETEFCLGCHEMQTYGASLFVDNPQSLAAVHYQNRLVRRDDACFSCHTNYAMFGTMKAKLNGMMHVYVHYLGDIPEKFELYEPYANANCLHCHDDGRRYIESPVHAPILTKLNSGETSCLSCHTLGHDLEGVANGNLWGAE